MAEPKNDPTSPTSPSAPKREARGGWRVIAFFFKTTIGCAAFALGSLIALILLLPTIASSTVGSLAEDEFEKRYMGKLAIDRVELAWFREQRIQSAVLSDPSGREVARFSASGPSLLDVISSGGTNLGRIRIELQADLISDDSGSTNLARAIEPRDPSVSATQVDDEDDGALAETLSELDVVVDVRIPFVTWSDRETRALGTPVEVRDLTATLAVHPGRPIRFEARGKQVSDAPGEISLDATIEGPIEPSRAWPVGPVDARAKIERLSTALVDGILGSNGELREALGPRFDLELVLARATPESGEIRVDLTAELAKLSIAGRIENGELRSGAEPLLSVTAAAPRGVIQRIVGAQLPPGASISVTTNGRPWEVRVTNVIVPMPKDTRGGAAAWLAGASALAAHVDVDLPGELAISFDRGAERPLRVGVSNTVLRVRAAPGQPWTVGLESALTGESTGELKLDSTVADVASSLTSGSLPRGDLTLHVGGVSTTALDALFLEAPTLAPLLGPDVAIDVSAREVSADGGTVTVDVRTERAALHAEATVADNVLRGAGERALSLKWNGDASAVNAMLAERALPIELASANLEVASSEFAVPIAAKAGAQQDLAKALEQGLAFKLRCNLPGVRFVDEKLESAKARVVASSPAIEANLAAGGALDVDLRVGIDTGVPGTLTLDATLADPWSWLATPTPGATPAATSRGAPTGTVEAKLAIDRIATASLDALIEQDGRVAGALGPEIACSVEAHALTPDAGKLSATVQSSALTMTFAGALENGALVARGEDGLSLTWRATREFILREASPHLPEGSEIAWPSPHGEITVAARELHVPLLDAQGKSSNPTASGSSGSTGASSLQGASGRVDVKVARLGYVDAKMRAAKIELGVRDTQLSLALAPGAPAKLDAKAVLDMGTPAELTADVSLADPWSMLAPEDPAAAPKWTADAQVKLAPMSTAWIGAWLDQRETLEPALGPTIDVSFVTAGASPRGARVVAALRSPTTSLEFTGSLSETEIATAAGEGLKLTLAADAFEALAAAKLPAGSKLEFVDAKAPVILQVSDVRMKLPRAPDAEAKDAVPVEAASPLTDAHPLASLRVKLKADVPTFEYSDATTASAGKPLVVRAMTCTASVEPSRAPSLSFTAAIEDDLPGDIRARIDAKEPLSELASAADLSALTVALDVVCRQVPTAWIDALAGQDGLLVDTLGPRIEVTAKSAAISKDAGQFTASLSSERAKVRCEGGFADGALTIQKVDGLNAQFGLTPLASERVVGRLMPMVVNLKKPVGAEPVLLSIDQLSFPLSADLSKLDAIVRVNLGEVTYQLLPGLESLLGLAGDPRTTRIPPLKVPIEKGVARYDDLPVRIGGRDYSVKGSYNLVDRSMRLGTEIPLSALGKRVNEKLEAVRDRLDPNLKIPIEIRGTWQSPRVSIGDDFLKRVIADAAQSELEGFLKDALGGKKKKKD